MALTTNEDQSDFPSVIRQTSATSTADADLLTGTTGRVYTLFVENVTGSPANAFLKIYDAKAPTVGTTDPIGVFRVRASINQIITFATGIKIETALSTACVQRGGTAGTSNPATTVATTIFGS